MKAVICDVKGCGKVIEGGPYNDFTRNEGVEWSVSVVLNGDMDRCEACSRKLFAKALRESWDSVKKARKTKPVLKVAA
jgi:hypothetical protein